MDYRGLTFLSIKLLGIWLLATGLFGLPRLIIILVESDANVALSSDLSYQFAAAFTSFVQIIIGLLLLIYTSRAGKKLLYKELLKLDLNVNQSKIFFAICLSLLGVFFMIEAIVDFVWLISKLTIMRRWDQSIIDTLFARSVESGILPSFFSTCIKFVISLALIWKSGFFVSKLRGALWDAVKFPEVSQEKTQSSTD